MNAAKPLELVVLLCGSICAAIGQVLLKLGAKGTFSPRDYWRKCLIVNAGTLFGAGRGCSTLF